MGGVSGRSPFLSLTADARDAIERKLGVTYAPATAVELDRAATRYVEQGHAFQRIADLEGFAHVDALAIDDGRAAIVLTVTGSIVLIGAPEPPKGRRRFVYQSIRGDGAPREGTLRLLEPIRVGHPIVGSRLKSSPVRTLGAAMRTAEWDDERRTLSTLTATLGRMDGGPLRKIEIGGVRSVFVQDERTRRKHADLDQAIERAEGELSVLLERLVASPAHDDALEAETVGTALYLGRLVLERGQDGAPEAQVARLETVSGETCVFLANAIDLHRPGAPPQRIPGGNIAGGEVVTGAPLALLDHSGSLVAILSRVRRLELKR